MLLQCKKKNGLNQMRSYLHPSSLPDGENLPGADESGHCRSPSTQREDGAQPRLQHLQQIAGGRPGRGHRAGKGRGIGELGAQIFFKRFSAILKASIPGHGPSIPMKMPTARLAREARAVKRDA